MTLYDRFEIISMGWDQYLVWDSVEEATIWETPDEDGGGLDQAIWFVEMYAYASEVSDL